MKREDFKIEVCANSVESVEAAVKAGAENCVQECRKGERHLHGARYAWHGKGWMPVCM